MVYLKGKDPMRKYLKLPEREYLLRCFSYEAHSGRLIWNFRPVEHFVSEVAAASWNGALPGKEAGCLRYHRGGRHLAVSIDSVDYRVDRVIVKMETGTEPRFVRHLNGDRTDNRWKNLGDLPKAPLPKQFTERWVGHVKKVGPNGRRIVRPSDATRWVAPGVYQCGNRFRARIKIDGKPVNLGYFDSAKKAAAAYRKAARTGRAHRTSP